jgi:hypothetical protein
MSAQSAEQLKTMIRTAQERYGEIDHADWDGERYRTPDTAKWQQATRDAVPEDHAEWREMVRVLAQGESYYGGQY